MSSPTSSPKRSARNSPSPQRKALQEKSSSETNEGASKVGRNAKPPLNDATIFTTTPFPTKPQHVLLPSTIRKQRSRQNVENELPILLGKVEDNSGGQENGGSRDKPRELRPRKAPNLQLKRSVTALRDIYEAQADRSRPSTAASPALRPTTASSRLRSMSSSEGLTGSNAWAFLPTVSSDDLATLPPLDRATVQKISSQSSFATRMKSQPITSSSPNFRTFQSSSPKFPVYRDVVSTDESDLLTSSAMDRSSSTGLDLSSSSGLEGASSPNFVRLGRSSSVGMSDPTPPSLDIIEESSSPNFVKLGTSSPRHISTPIKESPTYSEASTVQRKRKRTDGEDAPYAGRTPLFGGRVGRLDTKSPSSNTDSNSDEQILPSSPPRMGTFQSLSPESLSSIAEMHGALRDSIDSFATASAHSDLQQALSSSPMPQLQYPVVRAPSVNQFATISVAKRQSRGSTERTSSFQRQSTVSDLEPGWEDITPRPESSESQVSAISIVSRQEVSTDELEPPQMYMLENDTSGSRDFIISDADRQEAEAADELSALPRRSKRRPPTSIPKRSTSYQGTSINSSLALAIRTSTERPINSLRSLSYSRENSMRSGTLRPGSAGSAIVPTWAKKYYSGIYRDSFQYLYASNPNLNSMTNSSIPPPIIQRKSTHSDRPTTSIHTVSRSLNSIRSSINRFIPSIMIPKNRPRMDVRKSHMTAGIGPLVSNPVQYPAPVVHQTSRSFDYGRSTIRQIDEPLSPTDPRAHWVGVVEEEDEDMDQSEGQPRLSEYAASSQNTDPRRTRRPRIPIRSSLRLIRMPSPHLHHDHRLNTGSSASAGFGFPFNRKSHWEPPAVYDNNGNDWPNWFKADLRNTQVICFIAGFVFPLTWFIGAFLPLPHRPAAFHDIEKAELQARQAGQYDELDIVSRLRFERHMQGVEEIKWQNARWWKRMNKWMSCVGFVVIVVVIILAVIGTKSRWGQ